MGLWIEPERFEQPFHLPRRNRVVGWYWIAACAVSALMWLAIGAFIEALF